MEEIKLASVKFKSAGKIYYFSTNLKLKKDDRVVVETARGLELGEISQELKDISEFNLDTELKKIVRKATKKDIENYQKNVKDAKQALVTCKEIVSRYDVNMQLTNCEYTLDALINYDDLCQEMLHYLRLHGRCGRVTMPPKWT